MNFDPSLPNDSRRNFVKKSLAASIIAAQPTILAGLIRAQGGGGGTGTTDPWGTTDPGGTTSETTYNGETTDNDITAPTPKKKIYTSTLYWNGSAWVKDANSKKFYGPSPLPPRIAAPGPPQPPTGFWQPQSSDTNGQNPPSWINTTGIQWVGDWKVDWVPTPGTAPTGSLVAASGALADPVAAEYLVDGQGWYWALKWTITYEYPY